MSKIIYFSGILFCVFLVTSGQNFVDDFGNDIDKTQIENDLSKLNLGASCLSFLKIGGQNCQVDIMDKLKKSKLILEVAKASANHDDAKLTELQTKTTCCTMYLTIDCMETVAKNCKPDEQETIKNMLKVGLENVEKTHCSNYGYHSEKCNLDANTDDNKPYPAPTLPPDIKDKVGPTCQANILNGIKNCNQKAADKLKQRGMTDRSSTKNQCCGGWFMVDCEKDMIKVCNNSEQIKLLESIDQSVGKLENELCSSYHYQNTDCSGASTNSLNVVSVILFFLIFYFTKFN